MVVVPFASDAEAVALANDCDYGLGSSVFTRRPSRGRAIADALEAGMVSVNDFNATYTCQVGSCRAANCMAGPHGSGRRGGRRPWRGGEGGGCWLRRR